MKKIIISLLGLFGLINLEVKAQPFPVATTQPTTRPVGVWYQPIGSFQKWHNRGVNRLIGYENEGGGVSLDAWCASARANGFTYILQPTASSHWPDIACVAVQYLPDEPVATQSSCDVQAGVKVLKQQTTKPIFINFDLWKFQWMTDDQVTAYLASADWIGVDWYLANHGEGLGSLNGWTAQINRVKRLAPGKPITVFIECCDQKLYLQSWAQNPVPPQTTPWALNMHGPNITEMQVQYDTARSIGCDVAWFSDVIGKNWENFDGTVDSNAGAMTILNLHQ